MLRFAFVLVIVFVILIQTAQAHPRHSRHPKITTRISRAQTALWSCQHQIGRRKTRASSQPWALPHSASYRRWVLKRWHKRLAACERISSLGRRAVAIARQELGAPYVYGGTSPRGFDCSGLTSYIYGRLGISLPHNAAAQYQYGRPVDLRRLRPGDLLFFHGLGHVGLYIGHGKMIHAPNYGRNVEIQLLSSRGGAEGARRISVR